MKESYRENLASRSGHEPYAGSSNAPGVAWGSGDAGQPLSSEIHIPVCRPCTDKGKAISIHWDTQIEIVVEEVFRGKNLVYLWDPSAVKP